MRARKRDQCKFDAGRFGLLSGIVGVVNGVH